MSIQNESNTLLASIKQSLLEAGVEDSWSPQGRTPDTLVSEADEATAPHCLNVRVSKVPRTNKDLEYMYPYRPLEEKNIAYRGYPINGSSSLKRRSWRVQIVNCNIGAPLQPLPQFPQQEVLTQNGGTYRGGPRMHLTEKQAQYNSGEAWTHQNKDSLKPQSEYFFTAGYTEGSAVRLQKPVMESIYRSVVAGSPVPVKVLRE